MNHLSTKQMATLALMIAVVVVLSVTPFGTIPIGSLSITLNMIPIAIAGIAVGPAGGLIVGLVFGIFSFLQSMGVIMPSGLGMLTFSLSPAMTFVQRVVSRALVGFLVGLLFKLIRKLNTYVAYFVTGAAAAFLNFVFFMGSLILLFGQYADVASIWAGKTVWAYLIATFLSNTVFEIISTTVLTGIICTALKKARLINQEY